MSLKYRVYNLSLLNDINDHEVFEGSADCAT